MPVIEHWANTVYVIEQPLLWILFSGLLGFLTEFVRASWRPLLGLTPHPS